MAANKSIRQSLSFIILATLVVFSAATTARAGLVTEFSKAFTPPTIGPGSVSTLIFTIDNTANATPVTDLAFTDPLPSGVTIATPAAASTNCGGDALLTAPSGTSTITFSNGAVGASSVCTISVNVTSVSAGTYMNVSGDLMSSAGNLGSASADLTVATDRPGFTKVFSPSTVPVGTRSTLTFFIDNTANASPASTLDFTDNLPTGMVIAAPANASTDCGHPLIPAELTATPGTNVIDLFANGTALNPALAAGAICTVTVDVVPSGIGALGNVSGELISLVGASSLSSGMASNVLTVTVDPVSLVKEFTDDPVPPGGTVNLRFTIANRDRDRTANNIAFTDDLSLALMGLTAMGTPLANPCGSGSTLSGTSTLSLTGGNLAPGASCQFNVTLLVPAGATPGVYGNTTSSITADLGGSPVMGSPGSDALFVEAAPILTKQFTDDPVTAGDTVTLEFTITNTAATMADDIQFIDEFDPVIVSDAMLPADGFCGAGSSATFADLVPGSTLATLAVSNASLAPAGMPGDSCTFSVVLNVSAGAPTGTYPNRTSVITATVDGATVTGNPATDDLVIVSAPTLVKVFTDDPAVAGGTVTLKFELTHSDEAPTDATNIAFSDDLNAALAGLTAVGLPMDDVCGEDSSISGTTNLTFMGGNLATGEQCTFFVTLQVPDPAPAGDHTNTTSSVSAVVGGAAVSSAPASDDLNIASLLFTKEFTDDPAIPGGTATLQFTIDNVGPADATNLLFTDDLSAVLAGLTATGLPMNDICGTGSSLAGFSGDTFLLFSGGSLDAGQMCDFSVTLQVPGGAADGNYNNVTSNLSATIGGAGASLPPATDTLTVDSNLLALSKEFTNDPVPPGSTVNLRFDITNLDGSNAVSSLAFTDNLGAAFMGLAATGLPIAGCGGTVSGTDVISLTGGSLGPGASCSFNVTVSVPSNAPLGSAITNTTSSVTGTIGGLPVSGDPASDDLLIDFVLFSKAFDGPTVPGGTPTLTFTLQNLDTVNPVTSLSFSDNLGAALSGLAATGLPLFNVCGAGSQITGTSVLSFSGGSLDPGGMCVFNVPLLVPAGALPGAYNNVTSPLFSSGIQVAIPAGATLSVEPPPTFSKSFSPAFIGVGFSATLTFTIDNGASAVAANNLNFTDNLPAGIVVANTPSAATTCSGGTITATPGSSVIAYSGGSVGSDSTCLVQVVVTGIMPGAWLNVTGDLTSSSGNSGTASDTLTVNPQPGFDKEFFSNFIPVGGTSTLVFTIDNTGSTVNATSLNFTDNLPAAVTIANPANAFTNCSGGMLTAMAGGGTINYTGGTVNAGATCVVSVDVTSSTTGSHLNTSGDLTSSLGNSGPASDTLNVNPPPLFSKDFSPNPIDPGTVSTLTFTIDNSASTAPAAVSGNGPAPFTGDAKKTVAGGGSLAFTDTLPAEIVIATPANASTTCIGGTLTAPDGGSTISYSNGEVGAGAVCTVSVDVTSSVPGAHLNTSGDLTSNLGNSGPAQATLNVNSPSVPLFSKQFVPDTIAPGGVSTLTLTIDNGANAIPIGNLSVTDNLPAGMTLATPANASTTCMGGTLTAPDGGTTLSYSGGTVAANSSCTVTADVTSDQIDVTLTNTTGDLMSDAGNSGPASDDLILSLVPAPLFSKQFAPDIIVPGGVATMTLTIDNSANDVPVGGLSVTDNLPAGLTLAAPANASTTCMGGTLTAPDGGATLSYSGGTAPAGGTCTVTADVTGNLAGSVLTNTTGDLTSEAGNSGPASDDIEILAPPILAKSFTDDPLRPGAQGTLQFTLVNPDPTRALANVSFSDDLGAALPGLTAFDVGGGVDDRGNPLPVDDPCGVGSSLTGGSVVTLTGGNLAPGGSCTFVVRVLVPDDAVPGAYVNTTSTVTGDLGAFPVTGNPASDTLTVSPPPTDPMEITKTAATPQVFSGDPATFNISLRNIGGVLLSGISVDDPLAPNCSRSVPDLDVGGSFDYSCQSAPLTADLLNEATATATPAGGEPFSVSDTAAVAVLVRPVEITKTTATPQIDEGQTVTFTITVANTGGATLTGLAVEDPLTPDCEREVGMLPDLDPSESTMYMCTTEELFADLINVATVTAASGATDSDTATVDVINAIEILKEPVEQEILAGATATFNITVNNPGGSPRTAISVSDPATPSCARSIPDLAGGENFSYSCATGELFANLVNRATVTATANGGTVTASSTARVNVVNAEVDITKTAAVEQIAPGQTAIFTIRIENVGQGLITDISVADPLTPTCARAAGSLANLAAGESLEYTCETEPLFDTFTNVATLTATVVPAPAGAKKPAPAGPSQGTAPLTVTAVATATVFVVAGDIEIEKTANPQIVNSGQSSTFTITIRNVGPNLLSNLAVSDPLTPSCDRAAGTLPDLNPGESTSYTCDSGPLTSNLVNVATVTADTPTGDPQTASDSASVRLVGALEEIPTLSEIGMAALFLLLAGAGVLMMRRPQRQ